MPASYSWNLVSAPLSGSPPNVGTFVPQTPSGIDQRRKQFERGIKFANVPGGRADFVVHGGPRVHHVNSLLNVYQGPGDVLVDNGQYSGVVKFRFRDYRRFKMPDSINRIEFRSSDRFTNPVFPFTGQYPADHVFFVVAAGTTQFQGSMNIGRSRYVSGRLLGDLAIVAGGWLTNGITGSAIASAQTFFSGTGLWTTIAAMPFSKSQAAGVVLSGSGDFAVFGGTTSSFWDAAEGVRGCRYIAASGTWIPMANSASVSRRDFEVVQVPDGRVFLPGGLAASFTGSEFWDPATNLFSGTAPFPLEPLNRESFTTTLLSDGTVLVCGGRDPIDLAPSSHTFRFYPTIQSWSIEPSMSVGRAAHQATFIDGQVVVMGGFTSAATASFPFGFPGPLGGIGDDFGANSDVEMYDINARTWHTSTPMPVPRARFSTFGYLKDGGRVIVFGGYGNAEDPIEQVDIFTFENEDWTSVTPLVSGVFDIDVIQLNSVGAVDNNYKILIPGGALSGSTFSGSQLYTTSG